MKKILTLFLALFVLLTSTACCIGIPDSLSVETNEKLGIKNPLDINTETSTTSIPDDMQIYSGQSFSDGVAFVSLKNDKQRMREYVVIDTNGNILFDVDPTSMLFSALGKGGMRYKNGILVWENYIWDKSGTLIASPEITNYDKLVSQNLNGYVVAMKKEESFSGDIYLIGILNNKGEWKYPLSAEHPIAQEINQAVSNGSTIINVYISYISDTVWETSSIMFNDKYYNNITNELTEDYVRYKSMHAVGEDTGIHQYDTTGNHTLILKGIEAELFFEDAFIGRTPILNKNGNSYYMLYDYAGNVLINLSQYNIVNVYEKYTYYYNGHLLIQVDNGNGARYLCLINQNNELVFDPIRIGNDILDNNIVYSSLAEYGFIYHDYETNKVYRCDYLGNIVELGVFLSCGDFSNGPALVEDTERQIYYIDLNGNRVIG